MKDQLTDMLTRIKNGQQRRLKKIILLRPTPKLCIELLNLLQVEGYINGYRYVSKSNRHVEVYLKYTLLGDPVVYNITRISKPSNRVYVKAKALWTLNSGLGTFIISTPKGLMTDLDAKIVNQGGELLCSFL